MDLKYKIGICSCCGAEKLITQKSKRLCEKCRQAAMRKTPLKRQSTPIARSTKPIAKFSEKGKVKKRAEVDFYKRSWDSKSDWKDSCRCEECGVNIPSYRSNYISHILSRGAYPELSLHPLNFNILCSGIGFKDCHGKWETGDKASMIIYARNQKTIAQMLKDLQEGKNFAST